MKPEKPKTKSSPRLYNSPVIMDVFESIAAARLRQQEMAHAGDLAVDCAAREVNLNCKLRELTRRLGSVAQLVAEYDMPHDPRENQFIEDEIAEDLTKLAAAAIAWLESLTPKKP